MSSVTRSVRSKRRIKTGDGFLNSLINKLPFEIHLPRYQYCGPGTHLKKRLRRGDPGINQLDVACKKHDIAYSNNHDLGERHLADNELEQSAWHRVIDKNSSVGEKISALLVTNIMKAKQRLGMGHNKSTPKLRSKSKKRKNRKRKKTSQVAFGSAILRKVKNELKKLEGTKYTQNNLHKSVKVGLLAARKSVKLSGGKKKIKIPRIIAIPKVGGLLPLIPIFAGLSALGSLAGGAAGIVKTINAIKNSKRNGSGITGKIALESKGSGLFLKPYRTGLGLFIGNSKN